MILMFHKVSNFVTEISLHQNYFAMLDDKVANNPVRLTEAFADKPAIAKAGLYQNGAQ